MPERDYDKELADLLALVEAYLTTDQVKALDLAREIIATPQVKWIVTTSNRGCSNGQQK